MDSDEYGDDIADEDLVQALDQSGSFEMKLSTSRTNSGNAGSTPNNNDANHSNTAGLDELPTDAFSSSPDLERVARSIQATGTATQPNLNRAASSSFRQTNLFGEIIHTEDDPRPTQLGLGRIYRGDKSEPPCHHALDPETLKTWVYPRNLGAVRDYQYSIVKNGLFNNTLVALPTGLGKTFIAATVMLNFHRWTKDAKIVFVAPTKPLVAQQVEACFNIVGIARSETTMLTGESSPGVRADEWQTKRVFFMTPQTLLNDISRGYADPKSIVLLVVDEAHRATGEYAYAKVVKMMRRFNPFFRVLALTATPGSKIETVQEVMDNLGISHTEIRTEDSMDIRGYVHARNIDKRFLDPSDEIYEVKELFTKALKPMMDKLSQQNIYYGRDPMNITTFGLMKQEQEWFQNTGRQKPQGLQLMMRAIFAILKSLAHSIKLLSFHGIKPFYDNLKEFRSEVEAKGDKGSKYKKQLTSDRSFQEMMDKVDRWLRVPDFVGHPKLSELASTVMNHFMDVETNAGGEATGAATTRAIVFSEYRDSAEEIVRALNIHQPLIKATVFVGQADSKRSAGMKQSEQSETVEKFKRGEFNVLVATSIGEEGLDIGQVDLIVCYDASSSPIRMLQRMGRTGRKREGNVVLLLMKGKEEENFARAKDNYEVMQKLICEGSRFNFRHDLSARIVPRDARPEVDMQYIEIPIENTQNPSLPEPGRRKAAARVTKKKAPPKKFHMPDGVVTGFVNASNLDGTGTGGAKRGRPKMSRKDATPEPSELDQLASVPTVEAVTLSLQETAVLDRDYRSLPSGSNEVEETELPSLTAHPLLQRRLRPVGKVQHGLRTKKYVKLMRTLAARYRDPGERWTRPYGEEDESRWKELPVPAFASDSDNQAGGRSQRKSDKRQPAVTLSSSDASEKDEEERRPKKRKSIASAGRRSLDTTGFDVGLDDSEIIPGDVAVSRGSRGRGRPTNDGAAATSRTRGGKRKSAPAAQKGRGEGRGRRRRGRGGGRGINSDELGDNCERDSDMLDTDGSDSGGDLVDFVVGDDQTVSSAVPSSSLPTVGERAAVSASSSPVPVRTKGRRPGAGVGIGPSRLKSKPFYEPARFPSSQESLGREDDEELPDIDDMFPTEETPRAGAKTAIVIEKPEVSGDGDDSDEEDGGGVWPRQKNAGRQQRRRVRGVVMESEENEDEE